MKETRCISSGYGMDAVDGQALSNPSHLMDNQNYWKELVQEENPTPIEIHVFKSNLLKYLLLIEFRETRKQLERLLALADKSKWPQWTKDILNQIDSQRLAKDF